MQDLSRDPGGAAGCSRDHRMSDLIVNQSVTCPYCWERIGVAVDTSVPEQQYVEDCSVCCRPIVVTCTAADGHVIGIDVTAESP
jgi:hypothetical protein